MSAASSPTSPSRSPSPRRFPRPSLRQATLILPKTGQRIKKSITLHDPRDDGRAGEEAQPLLSEEEGANGGNVRQKDEPKYTNGVSRALNSVLTSKIGVDVFKCSLAYMLGCLATFVTPIGAIIGHQDSKHMVATITVYFHPARSAGSMLEAMVLAFIAFMYAAVISFASMAVSVGFGKRDQLVFGHVIVLIVFCGAGLGFVAWVKQRLSNPLVNVSTSLASLAIILILTKEGSIQVGVFSYNKIWQVLKMVLMGIFASVLVSFLVKPRSARKELREDLIKITDLLEEAFTIVSRSFLSGTDEEINSKSFIELTRQYRLTYTKLLKDLRDAKFEHYVLGTEAEARHEASLVKCIERLAQSSSGLRSAAASQFDLMKEVSQDVSSPYRRFSSSWAASNFALESPANDGRVDTLSAIVEEPSTIGGVSPSEGGNPLQDSSVHAPSAAAIFSLFIAELGPSMKSLAFTLREILDELPFSSDREHTIAAETNFRQSLIEAKELYIGARKRALDLLYKTRMLEATQFPKVAADYEEVAASCGYFSSCLQDFAEDTVVYLDILEDLRLELESHPKKRSWNWLLFWRGRSRIDSVSSPFRDPDPLDRDVERRTSVVIPKLKRRQLPHQPEDGRYKSRQALSARIWRALAVFRREDIRHAVKVGIGAILYAMFSFIPSTRPIYSHWRGEWGLLSFMLVCSMHVGASNTTGFQRFLGTCLGAVLAIGAWLVADDNPFVLGLLGWLVSLGCFYIILGQGRGPMGRFIILTYNLSALYAYSLSVQDDEDDDDEGGISPEIWGIVKHRVVAVMIGSLWGLVITRVIWPISARSKLKNGIAVLWLRMGIIWKRGPLSILEESDVQSSYFDTRESIKLRRFFDHLQGLQDAAFHEIELRGPFAAELWKDILDATNRVLGSFHAMDVVIQKDMKASAGEVALLKYTKEERRQLSGRLSHLMSVLASSMKLEYPIYDSLPKIEYARDRFLSKIFDFRHDAAVNHLATDADYELLYTYALVTYQIANEISKLYRYIEQLYGPLNEEGLELQ